MALILQNTNFIGLPGPSALVPKGSDIVISDDGTITEIHRTHEIPGRMHKTSPTLSPNYLDLDGMYISSGWIDLHTHVYYGVSDIGLKPELIGPVTGTSIVVDAGSAGSKTFLGLREYIIKPSPFPIYAFLNFGAIGLVWANHISELDTPDKIDLDGLCACIDANRDYIKGIKLRASGVVLKNQPTGIIKLAKKIAQEAQLPLIVHVGEPLPLLENILPHLTTGDIVTHIYHGKKPGLLHKAFPLPIAAEAYNKGIVFDLGHGAASFNYYVAQKAFEHGLLPHTISTDLHAQNINGPVYDLATTMSKTLALGLDLERVIQSVTTTPAHAIGVETYANGLIGKKARFTVFTLQETEVTLPDSNGNTLTVTSFINPEYTIIGHEVLPAKTRLSGI